MHSPPTQTRPQRHRFRDEVWAAVKIDNPGVALISSGQEIGILLARNVRQTTRGTILRGVQLVRIPQGWRLELLRLRSRLTWLLGKARLPDEWLFTRVILRQGGYRYLALLPGGDVLPTPAEQPFPLHIITEGQYRHLLEAPGRVLLAEVRQLFGRSIKPPAQRPSWRELLRPFKPFPLFGR